MNVGILGAYNLAWKLAAVHRGQAAETLLDSYSVEQRALARGVIRDMKLNVMEALLPAVPNRVRCAFLRATLPSRRFQQRGEWVMSDFGRHHRGSPLSWQHAPRPARGPRAGDRVPDVTVAATALRVADRALQVADRPPAPTPSPVAVVREGRGAAAGERPDLVSGPQRVRLHQLLPYDRWTLLLNADHSDEAALRAVRDACAAAPAPVTAFVVSADGPDARELGRPGEYRLVRPDRCVALVARSDRPDLLTDYFRTFLDS
jgi:hypothetical protein